MTAAAILGALGFAGTQVSGWLDERGGPAEHLNAQVLDRASTDAGVSFLLPGIPPLDAAGRPADCPGDAPCGLPLDDEEAVRGWLKSYDAYDVASSHLTLILSNVSSHQIDVIDARARTIYQDDLEFLSSFNFPAEGGMTVEGWAFNLDRPNPPPLIQNDAAALDELEPYFNRKFITLHPGERLPVDIVAYTTIHPVEWSIEVSFIDEGDKETIKLPGISRTAPTKMFSAQAARHWEWAEDGFNAVDSG